MRVLLRDIAEPTDGAFVDGPFGSNLKSDEYVESGVRLIQLQNIGDGYWKDDNKKFINAVKFRSLARHGAIPGDIAIAKMADPVARACIVPRGQEQYVVVADCIRLRVDETRFDPRYIVRAINGHGTRTEAERKSIGSTRIRINLGTLKTVSCLVPPLRQQQAIAGILDTLDTTIRQTEAIIEKLKQVKQGLVHDLLTRGIDANGELRPPPCKAPHLYKDSPLGWIPREWEALHLRDVGESVTGSTPPSVDPLAWGVGWPFITPVDVLEDHNIESAERSVSNRGASYVRMLPPKATLVVCIGSTIGKVGITAVEACTNQQINALVPSKNMAPEFVYLAVQMHVEQLRAMAGLQAVPIVNKTSFASIVIPIASLAEQTEIAGRIAAISARLRQESASATKMRALKSGLMDDLLTGRVRVTPLLQGGGQSPSEGNT
jgi:type I restriction enzyme S subunit